MRKNASGPTHGSIPRRGSEANPLIALGNFGDACTPADLEVVRMSPEEVARKLRVWVPEAAGEGAQSGKKARTGTVSA